MVEYDAVMKGSLFISFAIILMSLVEIVVSILFLFLELNFDGQKIFIFQLFLDRSNMPIRGLISWYCFFISIFLFIILGILIFLTAKKRNIELILHAKHFVVVGMLILIFSFIQLEYIYVLAHTPLYIERDHTFESMLYSRTIAPYPLAGAIWMFFIAIECAHLTIGIVFTATALKWNLELEKTAEEESKKKPVAQKIKETTEGSETDSTSSLK